MIRLLTIAHSGRQGGAEYCLDTTLAHLDRSRFEATVVFGGEGPMVEAAAGRGFAVDVQPLAWWLAIERSAWYFKNLLVGAPARVWRLARRIRRERFDLVYTNTAVVFEGALAARLAGVPHVWHVHEVMTREHMKPSLLPLEWIVRRIGRWSKRVIFESESARAICRGLIPEEKTLAVYNSLRFRQDDPLPDRRAARARFGIDDDRCVIAWVGRFSPRKNPLLAIRAAARMKSQPAPGVTFLLAGDGPLEDEMRETIGRLGLEAVCRMIPFQPDIRPLLAAADVLALTSTEESFGLVLVEAGACGKPVVATRTQGPAEIVADGQTGFLVPPGDEAALAARLDRLAADPALRERLGQAAAARVADLFSAEKNTRKIEAVFAEVLGLTGPAEPTVRTL